MAFHFAESHMLSPTLLRMPRRHLRTVNKVAQKLLYVSAASFLMVCLLALLVLGTADFRDFPHLDGNDLDIRVVNPGPAHPPRPLPELSKTITSKGNKSLPLPPSVEEFLKKPVINPHPYGFYHNSEDRCRREQTQVLVVIPSAPDNFLRRQLVRQSAVYNYAKRDSSSPSSHRVRVTVLFFLGFPRFVGTSTYEVQSLVNQEARQFGDLVQSEFKDVYRNIRLKAQCMLKWAATYCYNASYVIRLDDDVSVDPDLIIEAIYRIGAQHDNFVLGGEVKTGMKVIRNKTSSSDGGDYKYDKYTDKYAVSFEEYSFSIWPPFALGGLLGYPIKSVRLLYEASLRVQAVWLDDVYITGICAQHVDVALLQDRGFVFKHTWPDNRMWPEGVVAGLNYVGTLAAFIAVVVVVFRVLVLRHSDV